MSKNKIISKETAVQGFSELAAEYAIVHNPSFIHPAYEYYPLAVKSLEPVTEMKALVMDMDGTTTSTEELCIFSLEMMVRRITGRLSAEEWEGLDHTADLPYIIGNSTTKHVEYLIGKYGKGITEESFNYYFWYSAFRTLCFSKDAGRVKDVVITLNTVGYSSLTGRRSIAEFKSRVSDEQALKELASKYSNEYSVKPSALTPELLVRASVDIYYVVYHQILDALHSGDTEFLKHEFNLSITTGFIKPMPGIGFFLALSKGLLGSEAVNLFVRLFPNAETDFGKPVTEIKAGILKASEQFALKPLKIAVVTSSISYEAEIVLEQVFKVIRAEFEVWPVTPELKNTLNQAFSDSADFYDAIITATDSHEIRLKPHRDLYSIALSALGIAKEDFDKVAGFEDSQSGTLAIRAAGIGKCIAVPFAQTLGHDLSAAAMICIKGLPEFLVKTNLFLQ